MSSFSEEEIEEFKVEALELLESAEKSLLALDDGEDFKTHFDTIFRGFHNLKGAAGMMELNELQAHTHELESILMRFKTADEIPKAHISFFLRGIDAARSILDNEEVNFSYEVQEQGAQDLKEEINSPVKSSDSYHISENDPARDEFLYECEEIVERVSSCLQDLESMLYTKETIDALYRDVHSLKGSAYLFSCTILGDIGHAMESSLEKVRNETHTPSEKLVNGLFKSLEVIERVIQKMKTHSTIDDFAPIVPVLSKALALAADQLPEVEVRSKETSMEEETLEMMVEEIKAPVDLKVAPVKKEVSKPAFAQKNSVEKNDAQTGENASSIRVPVALLDNLMTLMGEMVLVRNQVLQYSNKTEDLEFLSMSKRLNVVTSEIQEEMMKTRMQPIGNVLSKFTRVVRDLSQDLKKSINLHLSGTETELDKSLLEAIKDPLTHIIRNACDHGIETPDIRLANGKPETGNVTVKAYHEGGQVIIEVRDDGRGLDKEKLISKAIEKNIITIAKAQTLSDKQVFALIFAPGFSTAQTVTNVSGRGVGMDVVRTNIEKIGGTIDLSGELGHGTVIKLKIPLTLAIIPALLVKCGEGTFAIPQVKLEELVRVDQLESETKIESLHGSPVFRLRGKILPLVDLNNILQINKEKRSDYSRGVYNIAVLNSDGTPFGVIVDEVMDTADIVVKPINRLMKTLQVYSGATVLGDGSIALIFDVLGISKVAQIESKKNMEEMVEKKSLASDVQDFLLIGLNSPTKHAITLNYVHRLEEFKSSDIELSGNQKVVRYREHLLPIISTNHSLGYQDEMEQKGQINVVVIEKAGAFYGLEVNGILDTYSTTREVKPVLRTHPGIFGNISEQDELIVVIDPFEIIGNESLLTDEVSAVTGNHSGNILLVEDTVFFRRAIKEVLEKKGYNVVTANDGLEALEALEKHEDFFDIIISDIEMPRVNGFDLVKAIRMENRWKTLPMIALSSKADKNHIKKGMEAGFDMYLEKFKPQVLCAAVAELTQTQEKRAS